MADTLPTCTTRLACVAVASPSIVATLDITREPTGATVASPANEVLPAHCVVLETVAVHAELGELEPRARIMLDCVAVAEAVR